MSRYLFPTSFWYQQPLIVSFIQAYIINRLTPIFYSCVTRCKEAIIYGQFLYLRRICSDETAFVEKNQKKLFFFRYSCYPRRIIKPAIELCPLPCAALISEPDETPAEQPGKWNISFSEKRLLSILNFVLRVTYCFFTSCWLAENHLSWKVLLCYLKANCRDHQ